MRPPPLSTKAARGQARAAPCQAQGQLQPGLAQLRVPPHHAQARVPVPQIPESCFGLSAGHHVSLGGHHDSRATMSQHDLRGPGATRVIRLGGYSDTICAVPLCLGHKVGLSGKLITTLNPQGSSCRERSELQGPVEWVLPVRGPAGRPCGSQRRQGLLPGWNMDRDADA